MYWEVLIHTQSGMTWKKATLYEEADAVDYAVKLTLPPDSEAIIRKVTKTCEIIENTS